MMENEDTVNNPTELVIFARVSDENDLNGETSHMTNILLKPDINSQHLTPDETVELVEIESIQKESIKVSQESELFVCDKCNRTFKQKSRYERHVANHPSEKHYLCDTCKKTFTRMSHLEKHMRAHTDERRHVCELCGAAFILPHHLVRHSLVHTGVRPFECDICQKQFTRKAGLSQHQYVHLGVKPFVCNVPSCGKQFTDRTTLRRHMLTHSREKPFICKECEKTFRTKSACRKHYLRHFKPEESFKCGICEEMFKSDLLLKQHTVIHEQKQRNGTYRCGFCLRVFKSQLDLDAHVPVHEHGLTHACSQCSAKFYTEIDLFNHMEKHVENGLMRSEIETKNSSTQAKTFAPDDVQISSTNTKKKGKDIIIRNSTDICTVPTNNTVICNNDSNNSKVVVVLQIPQSVSSSKGNEGPMQLDNIQQLLGNAQIDKLLVTTDKLSDSSSAFSLELSQDQQQGINQILQSTNITNYIRTPKHKTLGSTATCSQNIEDLSAHESLASSADLNEVHSSYVLTAVPHDSPDKESSQYIIVPSYKDSETSNLPAIDTPTFSTATEQYDLALPTAASKMRKFGGESVFKSNKTHLQQQQSLIVVDQNGVVSVQQASDKINTQTSTGGHDVYSMVTPYNNPGFSESSDSFQTSSDIEHRPLIQLDEGQSHENKTFFTSDYANSILTEAESNFS